MAGVTAVAAITPACCGPRHACRGKKEAALAHPQRFKVGDHVRWNSEAGHVSGRVVRVHVADFDYKGHRHHASDDKPQYEIKSDKTDHVAAHYGAALTRID